jgi:hypothetical protein
MLIPTLLVVAVGYFTNGATGEVVQAHAVMPSVTACANMINQNLEPNTLEDGSTWYLTQARCVVLKANENVTYDRHGNRE